jgi:predicted porin
MGARGRLAQTAPWRPLIRCAGAQYHLSQRTSVYLVGAYQHANGAFASIGDYGYTSSGKEQVIANLGLLHKF